jgi:hypothetical protein
MVKIPVSVKKKSVRATVTKPVSVTCNIVYTVFWVYMVSWVIKLKKLDEHNKLNELFIRNGHRNHNLMTSD